MQIILMNNLPRAIKLFNNSIVSLHLGDARTLHLPDQSVDCVVTSPPYWGLRDYALEPSVWDDNASCDHQWVYKHHDHEMRRGINLSRSSASTRGGAIKISQFDRNTYDVATCRCGAWLGTLGQEPTPEQYCTHMVAVFREVWRVLKPTGTVWMNLGDVYAQSGASGGSSPVGPRKTRQTDRTAQLKIGGMMGFGLKPKNLFGMPWRVAFALQADGWYLRSDIIWSKPNPMPESVTDRPTKAHEYMFLLTKSPRYYYDADAIREDGPSYTRKAGGYKEHYKQGASRFGRKGGFGDSDVTTYGRNKRTVWEIPTQPYPEAHFATYPEKLVEPCILAGSPEGGVILDPFVGSGTTLVVAQKLGRKGVGVDSNAEYLKLAQKRLESLSLPFDFASGQ